MSRFYAQKSNKAKGSSRSTEKVTPSPASTSTPPTVPRNCELVRFVLISGAALELKTESIEEVVETWADKCCKAVVGCKRDGTLVAIGVDRIDYMEGISEC